MRFLLSFCLVGIFSTSCFPAEEPPVYSAEVLATFPHDSNAFTQGLISIDGSLYEGTGRKGQSSLRLVELESGELLKRKNLSSRYFGEGITLLDDKIYQLTWQAEIAFIYEQDSFDTIDSFYLPGEGWGITNDGEYLIVSDGTANLRFIDPSTLQEVRRIEVTGFGGPINRLNELEYINGEVWANVWYQDFIVRINPETGAVNSLVNLAGLYPDRPTQDHVLNGIAWDEQNQRLFVTGKLWPNLFEIRILE